MQDFHGQHEINNLITTYRKRTICQDVMTSDHILNLKPLFLKQDVHGAFNFFIFYQKQKIHLYELLSTSQE